MAPENVAYKILRHQCNAIVLPSSQWSELLGFHGSASYLDPQESWRKAISVPIRGSLNAVNKTITKKRLLGTHYKDITHMWRGSDLFINMSSSGKEMNKSRTEILIYCPKPEL